MEMMVIITCMLRAWKVRRAVGCGLRQDVCCLIHLLACWDGEVGGLGGLIACTDGRDRGAQGFRRLSFKVIPSDYHGEPFEAFSSHNKYNA